MSVAFRSQGTVGTGSTSVTPGLPASLATGDAVLIFVMTKPDTATINVPAGWTLLADVAGGGGTTGNQVGPTRQAVLFREKDATWSTMPAVSVTGASASAAIAVAYSKAAGTTWGTAAATGTWGVAATTTDATTTLGSNPGLTAADMCVIGYSNMDDAPTWSGQDLVATGAGISGTVDERSDVVETTTGNDVGGMVYDVKVVSGTATAAPITSGVLNGAGRGTAALVRLREVAGGGGPTQYDAAGTIAATSATTGTASARLAGSGAVAGTSATTGTAAARLTASGTTAATSATTGAAVRTSPASGTVAATTATSGAATALLPAAGTTVATSGTTGAASVIGAAQQLPASGTVAASSATSGSAGVIVAAAGTVTVTSATIGAATAALAAAGITVAQATATGSASALLDTAGSVEAVSDTAGAADVIVATVEPPTPQRRIVSAVLTIPTLAADLEVPGSIAATITARAVRADLTIPEARGVLT